MKVQFSSTADMKTWISLLDRCAEISLFSLFSKSAVVCGVYDSMAAESHILFSSHLIGFFSWRQKRGRTRHRTKWLMGQVMNCMRRCSHPGNNERLCLEVSSAFKISQTTNIWPLFWGKEKLGAAHKEVTWRWEVKRKQDDISLKKKKKTVSLHFTINIDRFVHPLSPDVVLYMVLVCWLCNVFLVHVCGRLQKCCDRVNKMLESKLETN